MEVAEEAQRHLQSLRESLSVEVKNWLGGLNNNAEKARLAKEVIALANSGGGFIFIGFDDETMAPLVAEEHEFSAFTQDAINGLVNRYLTPPCHCQLVEVTVDEQLAHPVIYVPGNQRVPVFARRSSPDERTLVTGTVYLRRPGGNSEPARTQDDWTQLLDRLVKARQSEQINSIRAILSGATTDVKDRDNLSNWFEVSLNRWLGIVSDLPENDTRRCPHGYWASAFAIREARDIDLPRLRDALRSIRATSGWSPFLSSLNGEMAPYLFDNVIEAWLGVDGTPDLCDFWRISSSLEGFILRPHQEDTEGMFMRRKVDPGSAFAWSLPIWRNAEVLLRIQRLAQALDLGNLTVDYKLVYTGMNGRILSHLTGNVFGLTNGPCRQDRIDRTISFLIDDISLNLTDIIGELLRPVYARFNFAELRDEFLSATVQDVEAY